MLGEDTDMATGFYWAVVTASTIGYGDVVPTTFGEMPRDATGCEVSTNVQLHASIDSRQSHLELGTRLCRPRIHNRIYSLKLWVRHTVDDPAWEKPLVTLNEGIFLTPMDLERHFIHEGGK